MQSVETILKEEEEEEMRPARVYTLKGWCLAGTYVCDH